MKRQKYRALTAIFSFLLILQGCGYHLAGTRNSMPPHIHSVAIPVFKNNSSEPELHRDLTRTIRRSFIADGRLRVVGNDKADLLMKGRLNHYVLKAASFDTDDLISEYWVELTVDIEVTDQVQNKRFMKQTLKTKWDFRASSDVVLSEATRQAALQNAYRDLGNRLVSLVVDKF